jgi:hypothetical protein
MSVPFDPSHGPILVKAEVTGPDRSLALQLILDTGATTSLLNDAALLTLGYDLASVTDPIVNRAYFICRVESPRRLIFRSSSGSVRRGGSAGPLRSP